MTQAAGHPVANHRVTHRLADNQPEPRTAYADQGIAVGDIVVRVRERVYDEISPPDSLTAAHRAGEISTVVQPIRLRQHPSVRLRAIRQSVRSGPYGDAPKRWRGPHGSASGGGSRARAPDDGCSAGTSACPWPRSTLLELVGTGEVPEVFGDSDSALRTAVYAQSALAISVQRTAATAPRGDCMRVLIAPYRVKFGPHRAKRSVNVRPRIGSGRVPRCRLPVGRVRPSASRPAATRPGVTDADSNFS